MRYQPVEERPRRREGDGREDASTLFMLNCYDVWSATPQSASAFDCVAGCDTPSD